LDNAVYTKINYISSDNTSISSSSSIRGLRTVVIGLGLIYYCLLLACYYYIISPIYAGYGMSSWMLPAWTWLLSVMLALLPLFWLPLNFTRPSDFATWFLYLFLICPSNIVIYMVTIRPVSDVVILTMSLTASYLLFEYVRQKGVFKISALKWNTDVLFSAVLPILTMVLSIIVFYYANFEFNFSLESIYERRLVARYALISAPISRYMTASLMSVCVPVMLVYAFENRRWYYIGIVVFAVMVIFSFEGSKGMIARPFLLLLAYYMVTRHRERAGLWLLITFIIIVGLSILEEYIIGSNRIAVIIVRRQMFLTSQLTAYYWEFFSSNPFVMMKDSIIGWFIPVESNYSIQRSLLIGFEYLFNIEANANANIWATGFADFGYLGMAITSIIAALILKLFDGASKDKFIFASVCCASIGATWVNGALYTSLLTNGVLGLLLSFWLYPSNIGHRKPDMP